MTETTENIRLAKESEDEFYSVHTVNENLDKIDEAFGKKVDKKEGKELSSNDYTDEDKEKLDGIEAGAQANRVRGVKGSAQETYQEGLVNLTKEDIGLAQVNNTADKDKHVSQAVRLGMPRILKSPSDQTDYPIASFTVEEFSPSEEAIPGLPSGSYYHIYTGQSADGNYATQLALGMTVGNAAYRYKTAGVWSAWNSLIFSGNIGQQSVRRAAVASGIQSLQTDGVTEYPEGNYLIRSMFNGTGFKLVCKNGNSDASTYGVIADSADKAMTDGSGNVFADTYAKKSIYGDSEVNIGREDGTTVGYLSFALGFRVAASGRYSFSHGMQTYATGASSHAEGTATLASGSGSHAEGSGTKAIGSYSHAEGYETSSDNYASHACGKYNKAMVGGGSYLSQIGDAFVIGNGTSSSAKSNALRVTYKGDILGTKAFQSSGADYAEFIKPWADGNPEGEDRVGYFVTIKEGFLEKAGEGDYIVGITSGNPSVVGNADEDYYWRYERDEFNRIVMEDAPELAQEKDEEGNPLFDGETGAPVMVETGRMVKNARMKLAEGYDPSMQDDYVPRADRPEWDYVGMVGVIPVRDDGTCVPGRLCRCGLGGVATIAEERAFETYMVLERISDCVVSVILK